MITNSILPPGLENLAINPTTSKGSKGQLGQAEFMKLLMTQLQHQDPMNPMDNGQFLSQLAQIGTVNGITQLQTSFDQFSSAFQSNQALQASTLVGRSVLVQGDAAELQAGAGMNGAIDLPAATGSLTVSISDAFGQSVRQLQLGVQPAGTISFNWDGVMDDGRLAQPGLYKITARTSDGQSIVSQPVFVTARVDSVSLSQAGSGPSVNLRGLGSIPITQIKAVM